MSTECMFIVLSSIYVFPHPDMRLKIQVENLEAIEIDDGNTWQHLANVTSALKIESVTSLKNNKIEDWPNGTRQIELD